MTFTALGRVNVATPGTPVALSADPTVRAAKILFQVIPGLAGRATSGRAAWCARPWRTIRVLWPNASGGISDAFLIESKQDSDAQRLQLLHRYGRGRRRAAGQLLAGERPVGGGRDVGFPNFDLADARTRASKALVISS